jgi:signal transduction histidine kinase
MTLQLRPAQPWLAVAAELAIRFRWAMTMVNDRPRRLTIQSNIDSAGAIVVTVEDAGKGLNPAELNQIFDGFYTTKADGIGGGLSISRSIVEAHGGQLSASPGKPHGARFLIVLPSVEISGKGQPRIEAGSDASGALGPLSA